MFSIVMAMDMDRLSQFAKTKRAYDKMPQIKEFIIPTRSARELRLYLPDNNLMKNGKLISYVHTEGFNVSRALNLGVRNARFDNIIITSPEVLPTTDVLEQLEPLKGKNVICQVFDQDPDNKLTSLVNKEFRQESPAFYFLAMFNKKDIEAINGWDEDFMKGYAYEDNDFGSRWMRAGLPFEIHEEIQAIHQYHNRRETITGGTGINFQKFNQNNADGIIRCANGLKK